MNTKLISYIAAGMMAAGMGSCSDNWRADIDARGEGQLRTSTLTATVKNGEKILDDYKGVLKAASRATYSISDFLVTVNDVNGQQVEEWTFGSMPSLPTFPVGTYSVTVRSHEVKPAEWDKPYFVGEQAFQIKDGEVTDVPAIECKLANVAVAVKFDKRLLAAGNGGGDFKITVTSTPGTSLDFTTEETRTGYFEAVDGLSTLKVTFTGTVSGHEENTTAVLLNVEPGQRRNVTMMLKSNTTPAPDETGNVKVDGEGINVDFSVEVTDLTGDIDETESPVDPTYKPGEEGPEPGNEDEPPTPPVPGDDSIDFQSKTLDLDGPNNADDFGEDIQDAIVYITASKGVRHLEVEIVSDFLTEEFLNEVNMTTKFDLADAPGDPDDEDTLAGRLSGFGFPVHDQVIGKGVDEPLKFDITRFIPLIFEAGDHSFKITVTDMEGNVKGMTLLIRKF